MIIPLDKLVGWKGNIYEMTSAAIKRANQLTITGDEEVEINNGKVVPTAIKQILDKKVEYRIEE
ncbi:MAG: DNA-directed RNA polymerase subunit omega [Spirochaetaceae bacterium]|nr:DNA-directed RNA polymerase subunit omega [Spirochaetaceae bacterium]MCF7947092.1 DNA-directed RNA polymerase subunit omega [Spirochaetia bacterium]MCF7950093.1 DNA-directed RNA polymerase subunit omega [Spirochaetaceae bacterium]